MGSTLQIDGRVIHSGTAGLWRLLLDHTACERATAMSTLVVERMPPSTSSPRSSM